MVTLKTTLLSLPSLLFMAPLAIIRFSLWGGAWTLVRVGIAIVNSGLFLSSLYDGLHPWLIRTVPLPRNYVKPESPGK